MTETKDKSGLSRRDFLITAGAATLVVSGSAVISQKEAWGLKVENLKPETMQTIIQASRDIYPHDRLADKYYAIACKPFDNADLKDDIEKGIDILNSFAQAAFKRDYKDIGWESERVQVLRQVSDTPMFQKLRGNLITGLYNVKEVWPLFGYEGASADKGGYIERGFDDIDWI